VTAWLQLAREAVQHLAEMRQLLAELVEQGKAQR
jgi:hypothetical protein